MIACVPAASGVARALPPAVKPAVRCAFAALPSQHCRASTAEPAPLVVARRRADTEEVLAKYGTRTLHLDAFRDSVFELIDMYTPTTDERQYVGYMRQLFHQIAIVDANGKPVRWRHPWPKAEKGKALAKAVRAAFAAEGESGLGALFERWHAAQESGRREALQAEAAEAGEAPLTEETMLQRLDTFDELMPRSLESVCEDVAAKGSMPLPLSSDDPAALISLLKMIDVDGSGGISSDDLVARVLHRKRSAWQVGHGSRLASLLKVSKATKVSNGTPKAKAESPSRKGKGERSPSSS